LKKAPNDQFLWGVLALSIAALFTACPSRPTRTAAELQRLQGTWEGVEVGVESNGIVTLMITGNSLHFQEQHTKQLHEATFTLAAEANPQQLRATMTGVPTNSSGEVHIGQMVTARFKIEDGTLTLAGEPSDGWKSFEEHSYFHYKLRKVQPQKKNTEASTSK